MKTKLPHLILLGFISMIAVSILSACFPASTLLTEGTYKVEKILISDIQVDEYHSVWSTFVAANGQWVVEGVNLTFSHESVPGIPASSTTIEHRIVDGFLEQRGDLTNNRWVRENGTALSGHTSTRVEEDMIVIRYGAESTPGIHFGGTVHVYYALEEAPTPEE